MFFDYDGHASTAKDEKIIDLLRMFDNETENGKLYISYPMVESLKHIEVEKSFEEIFVSCNKNIHYKNLISKSCDKEFTQFSHYTLDTWRYLLDIHLKKMNYIVNDNFEFPSKLIQQDIIFKNQKSKFINTKSLVGVLSAFPVFIHDYFGNEKTKELIIQP